MKDDGEQQVCALGVVGPLHLDDVLFQGKKANRIAPLQVVRADRVVGFDHIRSAVLHAHRALDEGRNQADRLEVECLRYLAGKRTIKEGLDHVGVTDGCPAGIVFALGKHRQDAADYFVEMLGLPTTDAVWAISEQKLLDFGITAEAIAATTPDHRLDLALEAVAAVDLLRS